MTENHQEPNDLSNPGQLILMGAANVLTIISSLNPSLTFPLTVLTGGLNATLFVWQQKNLDKFISDFKAKFKDIESDKLDKTALNSDEFRSLVLQSVEEAAKTSSDLKREIFANVLVNSITFPKSTITKKQLLFRLLRDLSEEEMKVLKILVDEDGATTGYVADKLTIDKEDALTLCQGLLQLSLVKAPDQGEEDLTPYDPRTSKLHPTLQNATGIQRNYWSVKQLAKELIKWCSKD